MHLFGLTFVLFLLKLSAGNGFWKNIRSADEQAYKVAAELHLKDLTRSCCQQNWPCVSFTVVGMKIYTLNSPVGRTSTRRMKEQGTVATGEFFLTKYATKSIWLNG